MREIPNRIFTHKLIVYPQRMCFLAHQPGKALATSRSRCTSRIASPRQAARSELFAYLEGWYNRRRLHSAIGCTSPERFEFRFLLDNDSLHSQGSSALYVGAR